MESSRLKFKGDRKYVQSASVFDDILERVVGPVADIDFIFHKQTANQVHYRSEPPVDQADLVATWKDSSRKIFVVDSHDPVLESEGYEESMLVNMLSFAKDEVEVPDDLGGFTFIEGVVAGFKHQLLRREPTRKAKYVFARIRLKYVPDNNVVIRYGRKIGRFYQANLFCSGEKLGQIFYGEWQ